MMLHDAVPINGQINVKDGQWRHVRRLKGLHFARASLRGPVSSQDLIVEVDDDLGNLKGPSDHQSAKQVVIRITTELRNRNLRASNDHSLVQVLKHKAESASCECHRISAVNDDKAVIVLVVLFNDVGHRNLVLKVNA